MDVIEELNNKSILPSEMLVMLKKLKLFETTTERIEGIKMDDMITSNIKCRCLRQHRTKPRVLKNREKSGIINS